jgi:hypothetical protein
MQNIPMKLIFEIVRVNDMYKYLRNRMHELKRSLFPEIVPTMMDISGQDYEDKEYELRLKLFRDVVDLPIPSKRMGDRLLDVPNLDNGMMATIVV